MMATIGQYSLTNKTVTIVLCVTALLESIMIELTHMTQLPISGLRRYAD